MRYKAKIITCNSSSAARRLLWHTFSVDIQCLNRPDVHRGLEKPGAHIFSVVEGRGILETEGVQYELQPGNHVWLLDMTKPRSYRPLPGEVLIKCGVRFGGPGLQLWHSQLGGHKNSAFTVRDISVFNEAFRKLWLLIEKTPVDWEWQAHLLYTEMLGELLRSRSLLATGRIEMPEPIIRVLNAMAANSLRDWSVGELAQLSGISLSGLRKLFMAVLHENLHTFIQRSRLDQARLLLADKSLTIKEVAERLKFSSEFYFSHFFKRLEGVSPNEFRKQLRERR